MSRPAFAACLVSLLVAGACSSSNHAPNEAGGLSVGASGTSAAGRSGSGGTLSGGVGGDGDTAGNGGAAGHTDVAGSGGPPGGGVGGGGAPGGAGASAGGNQMAAGGGGTAGSSLGCVMAGGAGGLARCESCPGYPCMTDDTCTAWGPGESSNIDCVCNPNGRMECTHCEAAGGPPGYCATLGEPCSSAVFTATKGPTNCFDYTKPCATAADCPATLAPTCQGDEVVSFALASCTWGACKYVPSTVTCAGTCANGACTSFGGGGGSGGNAAGSGGAPAAGGGAGAGG